MSPVYLQSHFSRPVRYYALFKGWLLLSLPPDCLRKMSSLLLTLNRVLWALTQGTVDPVTGRQLTRHPRLLSSTEKTHSEFHPNPFYIFEKMPIQYGVNVFFFPEGFFFYKRKRARLITRRDLSIPFLIISALPRDLPQTGLS